MAHDIGAWLEELGLSKYAEAFVENGVDLRALPHLSEGDLKDLGVLLGHRRILLAAIASLQDPERARQGKEPASEPLSRGEAERRQLTVMFCDLVGSTKLSVELDPEELRDVIGRYQNTVVGEVARYDGHVAKFMGDGVLVYFGYPVAHEDDAERAVRASLGIVAVMGEQAAAGEGPRVRIGVATGRVVVGDLVGEGAAQEEAVIGETPNLASRLQELAAPGSVLVAQMTHDLLGDLFEVEDLGAQALKGFAEPISAWRVLGERVVESRFEAVHGGRLTAFVGREQELALLKERWARARDGEGQVVLLTGEAGIGKSRLTRALMEHLVEKRHTRLRYQCSPHHVNSALHPFIDQLERAAGFEVGDDAAAKQVKLEALLRRASDSIGEAMPLIAALLSVSLGGGVPGRELDPQRQKQLTHEALLDQLAGLAARQPVLMIFEDAHWADPTTLELLEQTVDRVQEARILAVITSRPEFDPPWPSHSHITTLTLNRLGRRQGAAIVSDLTGGKALPEEVLEQIVARTDGVPLFVEELTKTVLESGLLTDSGDRYELTGPLSTLAIPSTLQDSLMARLDRLAPAKEVAQIGATIGREFRHRLLAAVSPLGDDALEDSLEQLVGSELIFRRGTPPDATYIFKHALVQDAAYESLLKSKRKKLHRRIAQALEQDFPETVETEPEILAHHFAEAGLSEAAVEYWRRAGRRAVERSSNAEAIAHLNKGIELLDALPVSSERMRTEIALQTVLGVGLVQAEGGSSPNVHSTYSR